MSKMVMIPSYARRINGLIPVDFRQMIRNVTRSFVLLPVCAVVADLMCHLCLAMVPRDLVSHCGSFYDGAINTWHPYCWSQKAYMSFVIKVIFIMQKVFLLYSYEQIRFENKFIQTSKGMLGPKETWSLFKYY